MQDKLERVKQVAELAIMALSAIAIALNKSTIYYAYDYRYPIISIIGCIAIITTILHLARIWKNKYWIFISFPLWVVALLFLLFVDPYPKMSDIVFSGPYKVSEGDIIPFADNSIVENIKDGIGKVTSEFSRNNSPLALFVPLKTKQYMLPKEYLFGKSKSDLERIVHQNSRAAISVAVFIDDNESIGLSYGLNAKYFNIGGHDISAEESKMQDILSAIAASDSKDRLGDIARLIFIDMQSRFIDIQKRHNKVFSWNAIADQIMMELYKIRIKYPNVEKQLNFFAAGILMNYFDIFHGEMTCDDKIALIDAALKLWPYYPLKDAEEFSARYMSDEYHRWGFSNDNEMSINKPVIYEIAPLLGQMTAEDSRLMIIATYNEVINSSDDPYLKIYLYDIINRYKPVSELDKDDREIAEILQKELNGLYRDASNLPIFLRVKIAIGYLMLGYYWVGIGHEDLALNVMKKVGILYNNDNEVKTILNGMGSSDNLPKE